jgi:hypothetical protein
MRALGLTGWKNASRLQARRSSADESHVRTPRGLLATLGVTLSMVAAAACVLLFTSTLVAVNGWPGLSAAPDAGPVALAPVDRDLTAGGGDAGGDAGSPLVLGAPAAPSAPPAPVGLAPEPAPVAGPGGSGDAPSRIDSPSAPEGSTDVGTQGLPPTIPISRPPATAPSTPVIDTTPAVQAPATAPATVPAVMPPTDGAPGPSERRVTVNAPTAPAEDSWDDGGTWRPAPQQAPARRSFSPAPAPTMTEEHPVGEKPADKPVAEPDTSHGEQPPAKTPVRSFAPAPAPERVTLQAPSRPDGERTPPEHPRTDAGPKAQPEESAPQADPAPKPEPAPQADPQPEPKPEPQPKPDPEPQPSPPAAEQAPPAPEQAPAPEPAPAPPVEQIPATPPC